MEKTNSCKNIKEKILENIDKRNCLILKNNSKKRNHSEMINMNNKLIRDKFNMDEIDDFLSNSITKKFENLAIKKQFKVNKNKSIVKYYSEKPDNKTENDFDGKIFL